MTNEPLVELVPNVSEGRDHVKVRSMADALARPAGVWLLDVHSDPVHNRSVLTAAARPDRALAAAESLLATAIELIDMRRHEGAHPRVGAVDVLPLVALTGVSTEQTAALARNIAGELASRFKLPICLYGNVGRSGYERGLANIRRGGFESLDERIAAGELRPDFGPRRAHRSAGLTAVGARDFLIAFNVQLGTSELDLAKRIARTIRASSGGLPHLQALGFPLEERSLVQVSMNLTNFRVTSLADVYEAVSREASACGVAIESSELVGLVPRAASFHGMQERLRLRQRPGILEERLLTRLTST